MSIQPIVQLLEIELIGDNPSSYTQPMHWRMRLEALEALDDTISIAFVWVGSAASPNHDQVLDSFDVGPLAQGVTEFTMECDPPQVELVPTQEVLGVTILVISFQYREQEFLRVGYYTQVAYFDGRMNNCPPPVPQVELMGRFIAMPRPTVTVTPIAWNGGPSEGREALEPR
ncbi:anti-silencing protein ASF 1 like protein, putative [Trypanosoma equiperdum]|uniref:Histone chaperone ASF1A n=4 Tax=Trypanozoon TaxID=39700 RepID=ASF1A_TRYB2|nr:anti-silencing protein ASF 1 like protein, putative [Trypanosoma brucei brucei TREU927]XP_011771255.1 anti-silencing protein ASF 1 like protein,putative [Trypanosoma brucei gambiense DAL972]RHW74510.1 anti-silencing protein ASF 1 like protein [Trypanosoma brucei equiperdum]SCU72436.1 anti-silencing protein ASF 1 like protein, putative [Trypanosoma equiperdum]CAJ15961.1 anti-silencing protein ASF 1 like protein, putative [Trypanosoma brucei brucei TREU927]CBH08814.1 anti-silencing protein AS|eukprot:XP_011771255.1 anti-silencing protein ASF 1 like protein,putative [Trypanosoma brucei gambiense DAL972]